MPGLSLRRYYRLIDKLKSEGLTTSIITVVSKANAGTPDRLSKFFDWLLQLKEYEIGGRLNPCGNNPEQELPVPLLVEVYKSLAQFCLENGLSWSPMKDIASKLRGGDAVCTFNDCDPFHTKSAVVILGDGSVTNCMRTNQGDIVLRHPAKRTTRSDILKVIPQEYGGCRGCEYWNYCYGGCPSLAIDNDWRNRDHLCEMYKALFRFYGNVIKSIGNPVGKGQHKDFHNDYPEHTDKGEKREQDNSKARA